MKKALCNSLGRSILLALVAVLVLVPAGLAGASTGPTKLLKFGWGGRFFVRPDHILLPLPPETVVALAGPQRPQSRSGHFLWDPMKWNSWGISNAYGTATLWTRSCGTGPRA